jgi:hypothetical protein
MTVLKSADACAADSDGVPSDTLVYDLQFRLLLALNSGFQSSLGAFDRDHPEAVRQTFIMCSTRIPGLG